MMGSAVVCRFYSYHPSSERPSCSGCPWDDDGAWRHCPTCVMARMSAAAVEPQNAPAPSTVRLRRPHAHIVRVVGVLFVVQFDERGRQIGCVVRCGQDKAMALRVSKRLTRRRRAHT